MAVDVIFETHSTTEDNERGIATGWLGCRLSPLGREQAQELGARRRGWAEVVFTSDLRQAVETAEIAFGGTGIPILQDPRLRESNYGDLTGTAAVTLPRLEHIDLPYPNGESYRQVVGHVAAFLTDLRAGWDGRRVLIIGHSATRWSLAHLLGGVDLAAVASAPFVWREGWPYRLP